MISDQNPHPEDICQSQIPMGCPTHPPPPRQIRFAPDLLESHIQVKSAVSHYSGKKRECEFCAFICHSFVLPTFVSHWLIKYKLSAIILLLQIICIPFFWCELIMVRVWTCKANMNFRTADQQWWNKNIHTEIPGWEGGEVGVYIDTCIKNSKESDFYFYQFDYDQGVVKMSIKNNKFLLFIYYITAVKLLNPFWMIYCNRLTAKFSKYWSDEKLSHAVKLFLGTNWNKLS